MEEVYIWSERGNIIISNEHVVIFSCPTTHFFFFQLKLNFLGGERETFFLGGCSSAVAEFKIFLLFLLMVYLYPGQILFFYYQRLMFVSLLTIFGSFSASLRIYFFLYLSGQEI